MPTQDEIAEAFQEADARLARLRDRILANGDTALVEGEWAVRDVLSHLAARANGIARVVQRAEQARQASSAGPPPPRNVDEINAGQVEERRDRSVEQLLAELSDGHRAAVDAMRALDTPMLETMLPFGFRPGEASVAEMIIRGGPGHESNHLDLVEAVLSS
jgi:hypothetical protein